MHQKFGVSTILYKLDNNNKKKTFCNIINAFAALLSLVI